MPISVVVGGQYGSEGKGKVALELVRRDKSIKAVVRPGGTNSGHTGYDKAGKRIVLRQFPAAAIDGEVAVIFPAGAYIDPEIFFAELDRLRLRRDQVFVDPRAQIILPEHRVAEGDTGLISAIGSTGSGTGAAVASRIARFGAGVIPAVSAEEHSEFDAFCGRDVPELMSNLLAAGDRLLIEGTQGFGLSIFHGTSWPKATARDTTAAGFLSECGLPPGETDQVIMVLRSYPIRVAGDSGPLVGEVNWEEVREWSGSAQPLGEFTSVTQKLRRVGRFDPTIVKRAIMANAPTHIVLNHLDYVDASIASGHTLTRKAEDFLRWVEREIEMAIDGIGTGPTSLELMRSDGITW